MSAEVQNRSYVKEANIKPLLKIITRLSFPSQGRTAQLPLVMSLCVQRISLFLSINVQIIVITKITKQISIIERKGIIIY